MIGWFATWWRRIAGVSLLLAWAASVGWAWQTSAELAGGRVLAAWNKERLAAESARARDYLRAYKAADGAQISYQREREKNAAIARKQVAAAVSVARPDHECLSALVVQRLRDGADVPTDPGGVARGPGAAPGDSSLAASETDLARWIGQVREQYAGCRAQLSGIRDFERGAR